VDSTDLAHYKAVVKPAIRRVVGELEHDWGGPPSAAPPGAAGGGGGAAGGTQGGVVRWCGRGEWAALHLQAGCRLPECKALWLDALRCVRVRAPDRYGTAGLRRTAQPRPHQASSAAKLTHGQRVCL
jgi:hypothetical protein